jgi:hypothetical protein
VLARASSTQALSSGFETHRSASTAHQTCGRHRAALKRWRRLRLANAVRAPRVIRDGPGKLELVLDPASSDSEKAIPRLQRPVREHLGLDVAFVGGLVGDERVFGR